MFSESTYTNRRQGLKDKVDSGLILLLGNTLYPMNYPDNTFPFCQDWLHPSPYPEGNYDKNCRVDLGNLGFFVLHWMECTVNCI